MISKQLTEIYQLLFERFGPQHWWPGESQFEIITGAILTQNTNWPNVERAIGNLRTAGLLAPKKLHNMDVSELSELIRPTGYYRLKARRLKNFLVWLFENYNGQLTNLEKLSTGQLRDELLSITGIGRETADSILLYAFDREVFVVDAYTARIAARHGLIEPGADYEQIRELFQSNLPADAKLFNEFHALLVRVGKLYCRPKPKCSPSPSEGRGEDCPLEKLPHTLDPEPF